MPGAKALPPPPKERKELHPLVVIDQINKELLRQQTFGAVWGALVPGHPTTQAAALAQRKAELAALRAKLPAAGVTSTTSRSAFPPREDLGGLEVGLAKAFRTLKAGV